MSDVIDGDAGTGGPEGPRPGDDAGAGAGDDAGAGGSAGAGAGGSVVYRAGPAERNPGRYARRRRTIELTLAVAFPLVLLALWQLASARGSIDSRIYPTPTDIVTKTGELFTERGLGSQIWTSVQRMLWGFLWGSLFGLVAGVGMGMSRTLRKAVEPTLTGLYTVPKLALLPIYLSAFGVQNPDRTIIALIATTVFFFVWLSSLSAVVSVSDGHLEAADSFGAGRWKLFRHVLFPSALPAIFVGLRVAAGVTVLVLVGIEFVLGGSGLGYVINQGRLLGLIEQTYVGIVVVALIGVVFSALVRFVGRRAAPWADDDGPLIT